MKSTDSKRGPGRPPKYGETLVRMEVLLTPEARDEAYRLAKKRGGSASSVIRDWIDKGRK